MGSKRFKKCSEINNFNYFIFYISKFVCLVHSQLNYTKTSHTKSVLKYQKKHILLYNASV